MSSDMPHPSTPEGQQAMTQRINETAAKFRLASLASAIKEVRKRGGKWKEPADAIEWAHDEIQRLTAEINGRWIPVEDRMPPSSPVLVAIEGWPGEHFVACGSCTAGQWWYGRSGDEIKSRVTHWMPLPEPPQ